MIANRYWIGTCVAVTLLLCLTGGSAQALTRVDQLTLRHNGDFTELSISVPSHLLCEHFSLPPKGKRPFRIVLDICDAEHGLIQQIFNDLPSSVVKSIRTSQYATSPQAIVRVVLDLKSSATYTVRLTDGLVTLAVADPQCTGFAVWQAGAAVPIHVPNREESVTYAAVQKPSPAKRLTVSRNPEPMDEPVVAVKTSPVTVARISTKSQVSQNPEPMIEPVVIAKAEPVIVADNTPVSSKPQSQKPWEESVLPVKEEPVVVAKKIAPAAKTQQKSQFANQSQPALSLPPVPLVWSQHAIVVPDVAPTKAPIIPEPVFAHETEEIIPKFAQVSETPITIAAPVTQKPVPAEEAEIVTPTFAQVHKTQVAQSVARQFVVPERPLVLSPEYLEPGAKVAAAIQNPRTLASAVMPSSDESDGQNATDGYAGNPDESPLWASVNNTATAGPMSEIEEERSLIEKLKSKFFGNQPAPRPYSTSSVDPLEQIRRLEGSSDGNGMVFGPETPGSTPVNRAELLARIREAQKQAALYPNQPMMSTQWGGPPRVQITYDDQARRDPFLALLGGLRSGFVTDALPNVENLRMVGMLSDDYESIALLEDMEGHSYILRAGDPVVKGQVVAVTEQRVMFEVDDYGWQRHVTLRLSSRGSDPSKALGFQNVTGSAAVDDGDGQ